MTRFGLSHRDRRTIVRGTLSIGAIVIIGKGWPAVRGWESEWLAAAAEVRTQLQAAESRAASISLARDSTVIRMRRLEGMRAKLFGGPTADAAAASLGELIEDIARTEGADIQTLTLRPDSVVRDGFARVSVRFGGECDVKGLMRVLLAVETNARPMIVRELSVSQPDPAAPASRAEALRFDVTVETLARVAPRAAPSKERAR
jgi:hypothetical protein